MFLCFMCIRSDIVFRFVFWRKREQCVQNFRCYRDEDGEQEKHRARGEGVEMTRTEAATLCLCTITYCIVGLPASLTGQKKITRNLASEKENKKGEHSFAAQSWETWNKHGQIKIKETWREEGHSIHAVSVDWTRDLRIFSLTLSPNWAIPVAGFVCITER